MSFDLKFGNFTLEGTGDLNGNNPYRITEHFVPRRSGSITPRTPTKSSKQISMQGEIWRDNTTQIRDYFDGLQTKLDGGVDRLVLRDDGRFLHALVAQPGLGWSFRAASAPAQHAFYNLQFLAADPYWYAPTEQSDPQTVGAVNVLTFSITNNGGARTPIVMELLRTGTGQSKFDDIITNTTTGLYMRWNGTFLNGSRLIFDSVNKRVTIGGGNGLRDFQGTFLELEPGVNNLRYDGPGNATINTAWMERWS
jgi:hypothetical protein